MPINNILVIEPICKDFEHARFNSGLLASLSLAYPNAKLEFWSELQHKNQTFELIKSIIPVLNISYQELNISWSSIAWIRYLQEKRLVEKILKYSNHCDLIIFSSVTSSLILAIKAYLEKNKSTAKVIVIPHSVLEGLATPSKRIWNWPLSIRHVLKKKNPTNFHLIALSQSVYNSIKEYFEIGNWHVLDHPYIFDFQPTPLPRLNLNKINFGMLGAVRKYFVEYCSIAADIKRNFKNCDFFLVGHILNKKLRIKGADQVISNITYKPITYNEYGEILKKIHYIIMLHSEIHFKYAVSATVLDAFNYGIPGIYLKNPLIEEYRQSMGDIGYICNSIDEIKKTIMEILENFPKLHYLHQFSNIVNNRKKFDPGTISNMLKIIVENI